MLNVAIVYDFYIFQKWENLLILKILLDWKQKNANDVDL